MPTGYTSDIADGITFEKFALDCARAFGACIMLRDESGGGEKIPERFEPSDYHLKALEKARASLGEAQAMTDEACESAADQEYRDGEASRANNKAKMIGLREKYEAMLARVEAWEPPSADHVGMKEFMLKQITDSIKWDCGYDHYDKPTLRLTGVDWRDKQALKILHDIEYHKKEYAEEVDRTNQRNEWVRLLRESLRVTS